MQLTLMLLLAFVTSAAAAYAHKRLPAQTLTRKARIIGHSVLIGIGIAFGATVANIYSASTSAPVLFLIFVSAFGMVHVPAAFILLIKRYQ